MALQDLPPPSGGAARSAAASKPQITDVFAAAKLLAVHELVALRSRIDELLPARSIKSVSIEEELLLQLAAAKGLQQEVLSDDDTPANQKAQVVGQLTTVIGQLAKLQVDVYSSERLKDLEAVIIDLLAEWPMADQERFVAAYEARVVRL